MRLGLNSIFFVKSKSGEIIVKNSLVPMLYFNSSVKPLFSIDSVFIVKACYGATIMIAGSRFSVA